MSKSRKIVNHGTSEIEVLHSATSKIVLEYVDEHASIRTDPQGRFSFFNSMAATYAKKIAHNLLWHIDIDNTLSFARQNPQALNMTVEVTAPLDLHKHIEYFKDKNLQGQRIKGTPIQILAAAVEFDPFEITPDQKHYGLVPLLGACFPKANEYKQQLKEYFQDGHEEKTAKRMGRYLAAIDTLCQDIVNLDLNNRSTEELCNSPIANKFRGALLPDSKDVSDKGFAWHPCILRDLIEYAKENYKRLGTNAYTEKYQLFAAIAYSVFLTAPRSIIGMLNKGFGNIYIPNSPYSFETGELPDRLDFTNGNPDFLAGLGETDFLDKEGYKYSINRAATKIMQPSHLNLEFDEFIKQLDQQIKRYTLISEIEEVNVLSRKL